MSARVAFAPTDITVLSFWLEELRSRGAAWEVKVTANVSSLLAEPSVDPQSKPEAFVFCSSKGFTFKIRQKLKRHRPIVSLSLNKDERNPYPVDHTVNNFTKRINTVRLLLMTSQVGPKASYQHESYFQNGSYTDLLSPHRGSMRACLGLTQRATVRSIQSFLKDQTARSHSVNLYKHSQPLEVFCWPAAGRLWDGPKLLMSFSSGLWHSPCPACTALASSFVCFFLPTQTGELEQTTPIMNKVKCCNVTEMSISPAEPPKVMNKVTWQEGGGSEKAL